MFKILFYIFIYFSIHLNYVNCAPRFKRISNVEIHKENFTNLGNETEIQNMFNSSNNIQENGNKTESQDKAELENVNAANKKIKPISNIIEDKNIISTCENTKTDFEVILLDNIPKLQDMTPVYKIVSGDEQSIVDQNTLLFPKWLMQQQNKSPNKRNLEIANMILGLDELSMEDYGSEYSPLKRKFNSIVQELELAPFMGNKYCPAHILRKSPHTKKSKDVDKSSKDYVKICTCRVFEKPSK